MLPNTFVVRESMVEKVLGRMLEHEKICSFLLITKMYITKKEEANTNGYKNERNTQGWHTKTVSQTTTKNYIREKTKGKHYFQPLLS